MRYLGLALILTVSSVGIAAAQTTTTGSAQLSNSANNPNSSVVQPGIAKPPAGIPSTTSSGKQQMGVPPNMANNPTLPQVAMHPSATVGSPVPIAGPGGTTNSVAGNNHQSFTITRLFRRIFNTL